MDKYRNVYKEEAYELLSELETSLLELEEAPDDQALIDRVFRALHTIKGSGSMFGFDDIAEFAHEVETVFDLVRDGKIPVTKDKIDLALSARDHIKKMLDASDDEPPDSSVSERLIAAFRSFLPYDDEDPEDQEQEAVSLPPSLLRDPNFIYRIRFRPANNIFATGTNPLLLLNELRELGDLMIVAQTCDVPNIERIDPEVCYTYWDIILTTTADISTVRDVFIFVEDTCDIRIDLIDEGEESEDTGDYKRVGEILIERGDISSEELIRALADQRRIGEVLVEKSGIDQRVVESALAEQAYVKKIRDRRGETGPLSSIRVPAERLDGLVNLVGELVTVQAHLSQRAAFWKDPELISIAEEVERLTVDLRENTMQIRMMPIALMFNRFRRLIRDLSEELGKSVIMTMEGGDTELDKTVIEQLADPLMHIIRNFIDHGIETPEVREVRGKSREGHLRLTAAHSGANVLIRISGDGAGLDSEAIRARAEEKGLIPAHAELSEKEIFSLIFAPGFSTAKTISGVSGRGVGMDVVKRTIESLRGSVELTSEKGKGTTVTLKLPLTLAIIDGLLVRIGGSFFILPLSSVEECVELIREDLTRARQRNMMTFRDKIIPYLNLREIFMVKGEAPVIEQVIIAEAENTKVGFGVDRVMGQHQTVIKNLGKIYSDVEGISGATILGDGSVALILDAIQLVQSLENIGTQTQAVPV